MDVRALARFQPHLLGFECLDCGTNVGLDAPHGVCPNCRRPLLARYDLAAVAAAVSSADLSRFGADLWRYRAVLPFALDFPAVRLGEGGTPLKPAPRLGESLGLAALWIKDEAG